MATDEYGNTWVDDGSGGGYWIGSGANAGQFYYGGAWHLSEPSGGGTTYSQQTDTDGSVTGTPGAIYQRSSSGAISVIYRPSSGGGGSTNPTNVYVTNNPGELYQTVVSDGSDGYAAGTVYQVNQVTGAVTIKSRPATGSTATNFNDTNGDGYDDQTGLPNGAAYIGGKLYYHGIEINPDGSPKTSSPTQQSSILIDKDGSITGRAGTSYYFDEKGIPHTLVTGTAPSSGGSSSGGGLSGSGSVGGGGGGGGSTTTHAGGYNNTTTTTSIKDITPAAAAAELALAAVPHTSYSTSDIGPNTIANNAADRAQNQAQFNATEREKLANDYRAALNDVNPNAVRDWLYGHGQEMTDANGGNIWNAIMGGGDALNAETASGAAALLAQIRGLGGSVAGGLAGGGISASGAPAPQGTGTTSVPGGGTAGGTTTPAVANTTMLTINGRQYEVQNGGDGQPLLTDGGKTPNGRTIGMLYTLANPTNDPSAPKYLGKNGGTFDDQFNQQFQGPSRTISTEFSGTRPSITGNYSSLAEALKAGAYNPGTAPWFEGSVNTINHGGLAATTGGTSYNLSGLGGQSVNPYAPGYKTPEQLYAGSTSPLTGQLDTSIGKGTALPYGNDNPQYQLPPNQTVIPGIAAYAGGGLAQGPYISGDSLDSRPNPELNIPGPGGMQVVPLRQLPPQAAQQAMQRFPRHADGTYDRLGTYDATITYNRDPYAPIPYGADTQNTQIPPVAPYYDPAAPPNPAPSPPPVTPYYDPAAPPNPAPTSGPVSPLAPRAIAPVASVPQRVVPVGGNTTSDGTITAPTAGGGTTTISTGQADLINEILGQRRSAEVPNTSYMDVAFNNLPPSQRAAYYASLQEKYGVSAGDVEAERQRYALPGYRRSGFAGGGLRR